MPLEQDIKNCLGKIIITSTMRGLVKMNLVRDVSITNGKVKVTLSSAALAPDVQEWLADGIKESVGNLSKVKEVNVTFTDEPPKDLNEIGNVIAIMSGSVGVHFFPSAET